MHIIEPELDAIVKKGVEAGFLKATTIPEPADVFIIAVPTPFLETGSHKKIPKPDLSYIKSAAESISKVLKKGDIVILESTSPVGATEQMSVWLADCREDLTFPHTHGDSSDIRVAYCPERVLPGHIIQELVENDRIIGGMTYKCSKASIDVYRTFVKGNCVVTNARTAEMAKLTENSSRDVSIAFANELSIICDSLGIDVWELINLANLHPRVNILQPGPGVGGHCIAVDPWFIISKSQDESRLIYTARQVNDFKPQWVVEKVKLAVAEFLMSEPTKTAADVTIACFGLTFKPDIDDLRESPALSITRNIAQAHTGRVIAVEPNICSLKNEDFELVQVERAIKDADIAVLLVDHKEFKKMSKPSFSRLVDTKGIW